MKISTHGNVLEVSEIEALDAAHSSAFQSAVTAALPAIPSLIDIDLTRTRFVDCGGLGALVALRKTARRQNCNATLRLVNPPRALRRIAQLTGIDGTFSMSSTVNGSRWREAEIATG